MSSQMLNSVIEYLAVVACGISGGLPAIKKHYDVFSVLIIAWLTAVGGGLIRDVLLGAVPPVGVSDKWLILMAFASGVICLVFYPEITDLKRSMLVSDALALGLFAVNGTMKALNYGSSMTTAVFLGMATALGGGLIRDILLNVEPAVLRDKHFYAFPSLLGCVLTAVVYRVVQWDVVSNWWSIPLNVVVIVTVVALRLLSVKLNILLPGPVPRTHSHIKRRHRGG
ncbi:MAG: TRIC cation channel family protein [Bifidobacteriaceae bacterium]|jgi:uncharacterized membrane protein YeiH|nr:TRIC cation channel family protein [Bifidobacteriaceae bacterium]MCI1914146.1 TRIC cation channel family protein [Bifidobacteriaceae bacterium]